MEIIGSDNSLRQIGSGRVGLLTLRSMHNNAQVWARIGFM